MGEFVTITLNGKKVRADKDMNVLEAALKNDIYIPHLCYHQDLKATGVCRLCMVEIEGHRGLSVSCQVPVKQGLVIHTDSEEINQLRRVIVELLIVNHEIDKKGKFKKVLDYVGSGSDYLKRLKGMTKKKYIDTSNPFFKRDHNKCILCGICVRTCGELQKISCIDFAFRGHDTKISTFKDEPITESACESCGECVVRCPTGALVFKKHQKASREVKTICPYCGVGCGLYLGVKANKVIGVRGDSDNPVNRGRLCVKGRFGYDFINHPERLKFPLIKKKGKLIKASWKEAIKLIADKFSQYQGDKFAVLSSAKCTNEENYIIQKFARCVMGTNHIDHCARLCHAPTVAGLAQSFGSGAMTNSINEISGAASILAIGTNTTAAHPIIALEIKHAVEKGAKLIVANPKEIDLCQFADIFLQHKPGSDVALLMGMMGVIVREKLYEQAFIEERCENFEVFKKSLNNFKQDFIERITGVNYKRIEEAARLYAKHKPSSIFFAMGITQHSHGTDNVLATSNLAMLTGNIGKPSAGVNPLRGQNNVQGACDMGALPNVYPGYQKVDTPGIRKKFELAWNCNLIGKPGLTHVEIFEAIYKKKIKVLYLIGENPVISEANAGHVKEAIKKLDFLVVQDIFLSDTAKLADVVLPAASFAEKDGTFTNTERRIQRIRKAIKPIGKSKPDWVIISDIAKIMGKKGFDFFNSQKIMQEIASLTPSYGGVNYKRLEDNGLQWPCLNQKHKGTPILHVERFATASGKGKFMPLEYKPPAELPNVKYPFIFTTDRSLYHFHTSTMTRKVEGLDILNGQELLNINPKDAKKLKIVDGEMVKVSSRRGAIKVKARLTDVCPQGVTSMTFHFAETPTNVLTNSALDPVAKIPETKVCAVRIERIFKAKKIKDV